MDAIDIVKDKVFDLCDKASAMLESCSDDDLRCTLLHYFFSGVLACLWAEGYLSAYRLCVFRAEGSFRIDVEDCDTGNGFGIVLNKK